MYTIGQLSKTTGCAVETMRYYEKIGIINEPHRSSGGHRLYSKQQEKELAEATKLQNEKLEETLKERETEIAELKKLQEEKIAEATRIQTEKIAEVRSLQEEKNSEVKGLQNEVVTLRKKLTDVQVTHEKAIKTRDKEITELKTSVTKLSKVSTDFDTLRKRVDNLTRRG